MTTTTITLAAAALGAISSCSPSHTSHAGGTHPRDMTAAEHLDRASEHAEQAVAAGLGIAPTYTTPGYPYPYNTSYADMEHSQLSAAHRDAAEVLQTEYDVACATVPRELRSVSPFDVHTRGVEPAARGAIVHFDSEAGPLEALLTRLRCHRAWLFLEPRAAEGDNPLLVGNVTWVVRAAGDGIDVELTAGDAAAARELVRRVTATFERTRERPTP